MTSEYVVKNYQKFLVYDDLILEWKYFLWSKFLLQDRTMLDLPSHLIIKKNSTKMFVWKNCGKWIYRPNTIFMCCLIYYIWISIWNKTMLGLCMKKLKSPKFRHSLHLKHFVQPCLIIQVDICNYTTHDDLISKTQVDISICFD